MTIYDIAKEAGVSASSVSRVINNKTGVNPEVRKKVQKLLKKYHYTPDAAARGLVSQSSRIDRKSTRLNSSHSTSSRMPSSA